MHYPPGAGNDTMMKAFMSGLGAEPRATTSQEFAAFTRAKLVKWARVVRESGTHVD